MEVSIQQKTTSLHGENKPAGYVGALNPYQKSNVMPDTLPPIIMEVENDPIEEETSLVGTHSPLP